MAFDQSKAFTKLEQLVEQKDENEFIYDFLVAFGSPKATITKLKKNLGTSGTVLNNELILKNKLYFLTVEPGADLHSTLENVKNLASLSRDKIRFILITDFEDFLAYDLKAKDLLDIEFIDLAKNYAFFLPLAGIEKYEITSEHPADVKASYKMGQLCDVLRRINEIDTSEKRHSFNVFLTRILFCFYAEDTKIFSKNQMVSTITNTTDKSGKDLQEFFISLFNVLNLPPTANERQSLPNHLSEFPYVNGGLFEKDEWVPVFNNKARRLILEIGALEWNEINPDIFGSMFQAVIDPEQRGSLGQHYTSVPNIMKVIEPLFLNDLRQELDKSRKSPNRLKKLLLRLQRIRVFDPACGSGNFLIIAYKELRLIEIEIFKALNQLNNQTVFFDSGIALTQFFGIEIDDFAHEIALLSLWLAENQMNILFEKEFGYREPMLPLKSSGCIIHANSLTVEWSDVCPIQDSHGYFETYICGNPPFIHSKKRTDCQNKDMTRILGKVSGYKMIDYVGCWFEKCRLYFGQSTCSAAFVATNSLCQGEQASRLWPHLLSTVEISFAVQTFPWSNSARQKAAVHVIIIGIRNKSQEKFNKPKYLYVTNRTEIQIQQVKNISPYLVEGGDLAVFPRSMPLCDSEQMVYGNYYSKSAGLILAPSELNALLIIDPDAKQYVKRLLGSDEFLNGKERWCLWLADVCHNQLKKHPEILKRVDSVKRDRLDTKDKAMNAIADTPHIFRDTRNPEKYLLVPIVSSERRQYIPIGYFDSNTIATNKVFMIPNASLYTFGIVSSCMHMDWMRNVGGRLKSDYSYSNKLVYNTFPWPEVTLEQSEKISSLSEEILLIREDYPDLTLAKLYNPETMPDQLLRAHQQLDSAVQKLYTLKPLENSSQRLEFLFNRYEKLIAEEAK